MTTHHTYTYRTFEELDSLLREKLSVQRPGDLYAITDAPRCGVKVLEHDGLQYNAGDWQEINHDTQFFYIAHLTEAVALSSKTGPLLSLLMESQMVHPVGSPEALPVKGYMKAGLHAAQAFVLTAVGPGVAYGIDAESGREVIVGGDYCFTVGGQ